MKCLAHGLWAIGVMALAGCGGGSSGASTILQGTISFERPVVNDATGLVYGTPVVRPVRGATIRAIDTTSGAVIASASLSEIGAYSINVGSAGSVRLEILSECATPAIRVEDNTNGDTLHMATTSDQSVSGNTTFDHTIPMGWNGAGYDPVTRLSGPFNLLDLAYEAIAQFQAVRPAASFPACVINWSSNNVPAVGDPALGQIGSSHFDASSNELFFLGSEDVNTDEFDNHVVLRQWGHWFEVNMARTDSIGGSHAAGDRLDMRVAFSEGFRIALSAMILAPDARYVDTSGASQSSVAQVINVESNVVLNPGWFSVGTIASLLYDIFDSVDDGPDTVTLGLGPIYDAMVEGQKNTPFLTSIFTFINYMKTGATPALAPVDVAELDSLCVSQSISPVTDDRGSTETNDGGAASHLPIYGLAPVSGGPEFGVIQTMDVAMAGASNTNKLGSHRYAYLVANGAALTLRFGSNDDVEALAYKDGVLLASVDAVPGSGLEFIDLASTVGGDTYIAVFADKTLTGGATYNVQLVTNP